MNCTEFEALLQERLDGNQRDSSTYEEHLQRCPHCSSLHQASEQLIRGLARLPGISPPEGLADRIVVQVLSERRQKSQTHRFRMAVASIAAAVLVALFLGKATPPDIRPRTTATGEKDNGVPIARHEQTPTVAESISVDESVGEAGQALVSLVARTAGETVEQSRWLLPDTLAMANPPVPEIGFWPTAMQTPEPLRQASKGVSKGLQPVLKSAQNAVNLFLRDLPVKPMEEEE
ncbi:MAG: hypothetical protein KatS3mg105_2728 [Gemmatales bacterium]|nr:MAG: hypothetical protein KatS3mg105_2728 [Gemmatales bacterium]